MTEKEFIDSLNEDVVIVSKTEYDRLKGGNSDE